MGEGESGEEEVEDASSMNTEFWSALFQDWQAKLSTTGSIVLLFVSLWVKSTPRWITLAVAFVCFVFASRRIWMKEHEARLAAEFQLQAALAPKRTPAEQHYYEKARILLAGFNTRQRIAVDALRHLEKYGPLTYYGPGSNASSLVPTGMSLQDALWAYHALSGEVIKGEEQQGSGYQTFSVPEPTRQALRDLIYDKSLFAWN